MSDMTLFFERQRIREVAERYFFYSDLPDPSGVATCFAKDGIFRSLTQKEFQLCGREEIEAGYRSFTAWGRCCHLITSMSITIAGETATAKMFAVSYVAGAAREGDPLLVRGLTYSDRWIVEDGEWVIAERVHEALWQFQETQIHTQLPKRLS
jgi:SnoaL-like domain